MNLELVSRRGRQEAFRRKIGKDASYLKKNDPLLETVAEHEFREFRDGRTPSAKILDVLLGVVHEEQRAGRLIFDDLGALFWQLISRFPSVDAAYRERYPVVIADEHQDASALQDAVVRRLASGRLTIFADPMQLIHGFRGASPDRLDRHLAECDCKHSLSTPHRWHGNEATGRWLLALRERLVGNSVDAPRPGTVTIIESPPAYGFNGTLNSTKLAVLGAFERGLNSIAVVAWRNDHVTRLRDYLSRVGLYPRQVGGSDDFEDAREVIDQLPLLQDAQSVALQALDRVAALVPTLDGVVRKQVAQRLEVAGVRRQGCGRNAAPLLDALACIYRHGASYFFRAVVAALDACADSGHHLPRTEAVRAVRNTAEELGDEQDLERALRAYGQEVIRATHTAPRIGRGLYVMTAHQAKGKEFGAVVLVHATRDDFPDTQDGKRLFYVAMTRATNQWTIITPSNTATPLLRHL
jgi:hypothetical protein